MQGATDIPLNETGRAQAHRAAETLAGVHIDRIISSPMARAAETADVVAAFFLVVMIGLGDGQRDRSPGWHFRSMDSCLYISRGIHRQAPKLITTYCLPVNVPEGTKIYD